jgi:hypothetical protein
MSRPSETAGPAAKTADRVDLTRKQTALLARAAGVTADDVREAQLRMPSKGSFLMSLAYVHMLHHPVITRIEDENGRRFAAVREAVGLKRIWDVDKDVVALVAMGRRQAAGGPVSAERPAPFTDWTRRVLESRDAPTPKMGR